MKEKLAMVQGILFAATGIWPFVSLQTFLQVTGPKTDVWLVKTVAALVIVTGTVLMSAGWKKEVNLPVFLLGFLSAAAFACIEIYYTLNAVISPVYLLDAGLELLFIVLWIGSAMIKRDRLLFLSASPKK